MQKLAAVLGRMAISLIFILSGIGKLLDWEGAQEKIVQMLTQFSACMGQESVQAFINNNLIPHATLLAVLAIICELGGGVLLFLGIRVRFAAFLVILFLVPTTIIFHGFWMVAGPDRDLQMIMFLKNLSIFGGLLTVLALGSGSSAAHKPKNPE